MAITFIKGVEIDSEKLNAFKIAEWPKENAIHFGDLSVIDFTKREFVFVAVENEEILGYVKFVTDTGISEITSVIVAEKYRGRGIGKSLLLKAEDVCKEMGVHKIWLTTGVDWRAKQLYKDLGYVEVYILKNHYGHKDFALMEKFIESPL